MSIRNDAEETLRPAPRGTLAEVGRDLSERSYARRGVSKSELPIRVLLVDDHRLVRAGMRLILRAFSDICVVGEAAGGDQACEMAVRLRPDVIVSDLDMPEGDGLTMTRALRRELSNVRVLIVSMHTEAERLLPLLDAGARGYLCKSAVERDLGDAIRVVAAGEVYVRPVIASELAMSKVPTDKRRGDAKGRLAQLSKRERSVLILSAQGYNGPETGRRLGINSKTVDTYKQRIEEKLGISHRTDYVRLALEADVLSASSPGEEA